jgi:hypothetical protein
MAGQAQGQAAMQPYPQQMQQARFMPSAMSNQFMGMSQMFPTAMLQSYGKYGGYVPPTPGYVPQAAPATTVTATQPEQTPGYVPAAPVVTTTAVQQTTPTFGGGSAMFSNPISLSKQEQRGRQLVQSSPFRFVAPSNVSLSKNFQADLQALQNQYASPANLYRQGGRLNRSAAAQYNQQMAALSTNQDYQKAVRDLMQREGLGGLLGA